MTESAKTTCPKCRKRKLRRLIGAGGAIMFKGSGFYKTDYRSESYKKGAAADSAGSSGKDGGKDGGSKSAGKGPSSGGPKGGD
jgi:predicted nucleic acid-binding Zn ribbon protein